MATVKVRRAFWDRLAKANRLPGESFRASAGRAKQIVGALPDGYVEVSEDDGPDVRSMSVQELRALAAERGAKVPAKATKATLLELLGA